MSAYRAPRPLLYSGAVGSGRTSRDGQAGRVQAKAPSRRGVRTPYPTQPPTVTPGSTGLSAKQVVFADAPSRSASGGTPHPHSPLDFAVPITLLRSRRAQWTRRCAGGSGKQRLNKR